jgi:predicted nuclease of predicted toxin-antitoxin system
MRILFDQGVPLPLKRWLTSHEVETARQRGWSDFLNGDLLAAAEAAGFNLFITTDQNLRHQLDLGQFPIAVLVLMVANWPALEPFASEIVGAVDKIIPGQYVEWFPP